ncbi:MAG: DUF3313 family protein [bacterium]
MPTIARNAASSRSLAFTCLALVVSAGLAACGGGAQARTGFIPSSVRLAKTDDLTRSWRATSFDGTGYGRIVVMPVSMPQPDEYGDLDAEQLRTCRETLEEELRTKLANGIVGGSGDRTLVVRAAITAIKPNKPLLNVAPQTQIMKRGYGYASCEIYATDGDGGSIVAAFMQTSDTSRFSDEKLSQTGTARRAAGDWADEFRTLLMR